MQVDRLTRDLEELSAEQLAELPAEVLDALTLAHRSAYGHLAAEYRRRRGEQSGSGFSQTPSEQ